MAQQRSNHLKDLLGEIISLHTSPEGFEWLKEKAHSAAQFHTSFITAPRKTGRKIIELAEGQQKNIESARNGFNIQGWTVDRLARVWLLLSLDASDKEKYITAIEKLFPAAEINELVALYSALPVLEYPESWTARCAEGIRNNIGDVLLAIMCDNPYPSENLNEAAWNQLVLKAFFTEKPIHRIIGLDHRSNLRLASTLSDYAHERWAAHRSVNPQLWRLIGKFIDGGLFSDIEKLSLSTIEVEKEAAALACNDSSYAPAKELLNRNKNIQSAINSGDLTWDKLAEKTSDYVLQ
jgi:hypothetical protein